MKKLSMLLVSLAFAGCAMFTINDPVRVGIYSAKQTYMIGRESAVIACARGIAKPDTCAKFRDSDRRYTEQHNKIVDLYIAAQPVADGAVESLQKLADEAKALADRINTEGSK